MWSAAEMDVNQLIKAIREDNRSGSVALTLKAGEGLLSYVQALRNASPGEARRAIAELAVELALAQPAMAALFNLANIALFALDSADDGKMLAHIDAAVTEFCASLKRSTEAIAERAARLISDNAVIITNSASATVFECFKKAHKLNKRFRVICPESRPMLEGVELARRLSALKIPVTLIADALAPSLVAEADLVLVGGDALSREGLINKIGTYSLALASRAAGVEFWALLSTHKFLNERIPIPDMNPNELLPQPLEGVQICNRYFDVTPLNLISRVITEEREQNPTQIAKSLVQRKVHPALRLDFRRKRGENKDGSHEPNSI